MRNSIVLNLIHCEISNSAPCHPFYVRFFRGSFAASDSCRTTSFPLTGQTTTTMFEMPFGSGC